MKISQRVPQTSRGDANPLDSHFWKADWSGLLGYKQCHILQAETLYVHFNALLDTVIDYFGNEVTERSGVVVNSPVSYLGGAGFDSCPEDRLS